MNKNKLAIVAFVLPAVLVGYINKANALGLSNPLTSNNDKIDFNITVEKLVQQYGENYRTYLQNVSNSTSIGKEIESILSKESNESLNYIGGNYIDDNGIYTLQIVKNNIPTMKNQVTTYNKITSQDSINIEYVENSYSDLNKINDKIISYFTKNNNNVGLVENYVDVYNNNVTVKLKDLSQEKINEFKETVINSPVIHFEKGETIVNTANLNPGQKLESNIGCSVGFRAKLNNKIGYVTAGHCVTGHPEGTGINTGTVKISRINQTLDAAFIETYGSYTPTNTLNNPLAGTLTLNVGTTNPFYTTGTPVGKSAQVSGARLGKITSLGWSGTICTEEDANNNCLATIYQTGMLATDIYNIKGDSGGPVALYSFTVKSGDLLGIGIGGYNGGNQTIVNKTSVILSGLGVTRY